MVCVECESIDVVKSKRIGVGVSRQPSSPWTDSEAASTVTPLSPPQHNNPNNMNVHTSIVPTVISKGFAKLHAPLNGGRK